MVKKRTKSLMMMLLSVMVMVVLGASSVFASANASAKDLKAQGELRDYVYKNISSNQYSVDGGGYLSGQELFESTKLSNGTQTYDLSEDQFGKLTSSAQTQVVQDIAQYSTNAVSDTTSTPNVSESTVQNWWKQLQTKQGVGSKFMNQILQNTKPDFVTANQIYAPFSGVVGTVLGLIAVLLMAFLGIVMVSDIAYITLPPVRMFVSEDDKGKFAKSKLFSHDALYAVECAENESDKGSGNGKQALGIYFKRRIFMLILLGICLMYLVQGQIYVLVGYILDLVSGFIGF